MGSPARFVRRLINAVRPRRVEPDLAREVAAHLALLEDDFQRRGLTPDEARLAARRAFGGVELTKDRHRDARSFVWLDDARRDLLYAFRTLRRAPGFAIAIVLTLAVGIGANTALFSVLDGVVLKPLAYPDADRIVTVLNRWTDTGVTIPRLTGADEMDVSASPGIFEAFAYYNGGEMGVQLGDHAEFASTRLVHPDFFRVFGVMPAAGRIFTREDAQRAAVVGAEFARRNFGTERGAIGRTVFVEDRAYDVVGVMPALMRFPSNTEVWLADALDPSNRNRSGHNYRVVAKLAPGKSIESANAQLAALATQLGRAFPDTNGRKSFLVTPLRDSLVSNVRSMLFIIMAAVGLVLLIACANVANLMLAHAAGRSREVAVRAALGATRRHIVGQLFAESLVLALAAGASGLLLARTLTDTLLNVGSRYVPLPRLDDVHMDWRVLLFTAAASVITAVGFGLMPALQLSRANAGDALNQNGARGSVGAGSSRMRNGLVIVQIALSYMLAINAGLFLRSFVTLTETPLGFRTESILVAYAHVPARGSIFDGKGVENYVRVGQRFDDLFSRLRALRGVTAVSGAMGLPTGQYDSDGSYAVEGKHVFGGDFRRLPQAGFRLSAPRYFATMGIPLVRGREFNDGDLYDRPYVAIISESLARQSFGSDDPIGHRLMCGLDQPDKWMTIVGVVGDVRQASPASRPGPELYMPLRQHPYAANEVQIVMRTSLPPESFIGAVEQTVRAVSPDIALKFTTMEASVGDSIAAPRFRMTLVTTFAAIALLLAVAGMYAVMSYVTSQRTSEFGLRAALGAAASDLVRLVLRDAVWLVVIGSGAGIGLAVATSRIVATMLFEVAPVDAWTYSAVLAVAIPLVILAAVMPALRAARVDPMIALRCE